MYEPSEHVMFYLTKKTKCVDVLDNLFFEIFHLDELPINP